jgi:hypothetical protein
VLEPDQTNVSQKGGGATATGGSAITDVGVDVVSTNENVNLNTNMNKNMNKNINSNKASASQTQNQQQKQRTKAVQGQVQGQMTTSGNGGWTPGDGNPH